jgi:hypothetical protein
MSRYTAAIGLAVLGVSCVVAVVRGQDGSSREPGLLPAGSDAAQLVPLNQTSGESGNRPQSAFLGRASSPILRPSAFEAPAPEGAPPASSSMPPRPSAAERLQQVKETASGRVTAGISGGRAVTGPVNTNPVELSRRPRSTGPVRAEIGDKAAALAAPGASDGTTSVLKRPDDGPAPERTARRLLRSNRR